MGKSTKMAKLVKFMPALDTKYVDCFKYNSVLILFYHAATNHIEWKLGDKCYVIHFLNFAGMLPVIFGISSPSSHFCQARQKRKLPVKMTGMTGPS